MVDLGDPDLYATTKRYGMWQEYSSNDAVIWSDPGSSPGGFWSVFSHRDCSRVLDAAAPFTSEYGMLIGFDSEHPDRGGGSMLVTTDGERHAVLRRVIGRHLARAAANRLQDFIDEQIRDLLAGCRDAVTVDVADGIGPQLPAAVVCEIMGVPQADREYLIALTGSAFASPSSDSAAAASEEAHAEIFFYFEEQIARAGASDGLIGTLSSDGRLSSADVLVNCYNLLIGGNQTSRHLVAGCFHVLAAYPDLLPALRADPAIAGPAVDEIIRWLSPGMHVLRVATAETTLGGQPIKAREAVVAWIAAANRDARVFPDPGRFRWDRRRSGHLAFGHGPHLCLGANIVRIEITALLRALASAVDSVCLAREPEGTRSNLIQGYQSLEVELTWRDRA